MLFSDRENGGDFGADCNLIIVPHLQVTADNESPHLYNRAISAGGGLLAGGNGKNGRHKFKFFEDLQRATLATHHFYAENNGNECQSKARSPWILRRLVGQFFKIWHFLTFFYFNFQNWDRWPTVNPPFRFFHHLIFPISVATSPSQFASGYRKMGWWRGGTKLGISINLENGWEGRKWGKWSEIGIKFQFEPIKGGGG